MTTQDPILDRSTVGNERTLPPPRLPPQIQRQVDRARQIEALSKGEVPAETPAAAPETPAAPEMPAVPAAPEISFTGYPTLVAPPGRENDLGYWKSRAQAADGIAKGNSKELLALRKENAELKAKLETASAPAAPAPAAVDPNAIDLIAEGYTPEQIEEHGEPFLKQQVSIARRAAQAAAEAASKPLKADAEARKAAEVAEAKSSEETAKQRFMDRVTELLPEWKAIDSRDDWKTYCAGIDDDGIVRQEKMQVHIRNRNADRVVAMFKAFLATLGAMPRPPQPSPLPQGTGAGSGGGAQALPDMPVEFSSRGYAKWKSLLAKSGGVYRSPALTKQIEDRFNAAIHSGTLPGQVR